MEKIILDVDAGLVRFCLDATPSRKWWWIFDRCWWKDHFWAIWKRLFPPDLWGPYGPWGRIWRVIVAGLPQRMRWRARADTLARRIPR
jgi:hypothetical protein